MAAMRILRTLLALLVIQNAVPASALAAFARVAAPVSASPVLTVVPVLPNVLGSMPTGLGSRALSPLSAPALNAISSPKVNPNAAIPVQMPAAAAAVPLALPLAAATAGSVESAAPEQAAAQAPNALSSVHIAADVAADVVAKPSNQETDSSRVDFVNVSPKRGVWADLTATIGDPVSGLGRLLPFGRRAAASSDHPAPPVPRLLALQSGTFGAQVASNSLQVTMPLLLLHLSGSAAITAFAATLSSALDAAGTVLGGWLVDRVGSRPVLLGTTIVRGAAVLALPLLALSTGLSVPLVLAAYMAESFARGVADTARNIVPSELAGQDESRLKSILAKNQVWFEAGGIAGPLLAGLLIAGAGGAAAAGALWLAPGVFAAVALAYLGLPARGSTPSASAQAPDSGRPVFNGWTKWALAGTALLTVYPLKGLLPAVFAEQILHNPASAAWLVGLFGAGGLLGSLIYGRFSDRAGLKTWLAAGAVGTLALAAAFLPGAFLPAARGDTRFLCGQRGGEALAQRSHPGPRPGRQGRRVGWRRALHREPLFSGRALHLRAGLLRGRGSRRGVLAHGRRNRRGSHRSGLDGASARGSPGRSRRVRRFG